MIVKLDASRYKRLEESCKTPRGLSNQAALQIKHLRSSGSSTIDFFKKTISLIWHIMDIIFVKNKNPLNSN